MQPDDLVKIALSIFAGGLIGLEREYRDKAAGFRTLIFICMGSAIFTILSSRLANGNDPTRIAASLVAGLGFLGAGAILRENGRVTGLTTAATIWLVAALGMAFGGGEYLLGISATLITLVVLWLFPHIERLVNLNWQQDTYEIVIGRDSAKIEQIDALIKRAKLRIHSRRFEKVGDQIHVIYETGGPPSAHINLTTDLLKDPGIHSFHH